jgi:hypothetical protein
VNTQKIVLCQYIDEKFSVARFSLPCECGYDNQVTGFCPLPGQDFLFTHGQLMFNALNQSQACHTVERFDLKAHRDCGVPASNPDDLVRFYQALDSQFQLNYWSFAQSNEAYDCLHGVFPFSSQQVMANAIHLMALMSIIVVSLVAFF